MINVIDSMCGSGKSTKMFQLMQEMYDENPNKRFLYVTPFLSEIDERVPKELPRMNFKTPENKGAGKLSSLCDLVIKGDNIATTHVLFSVLTPEIVDQIIKMKYVLVIDEEVPFFHKMQPVSVDTAVEELLDGLMNKRRSKAVRRNAEIEKKPCIHSDIHRQINVMPIEYHDIVLFCKEITGFKRIEYDIFLCGGD